MAGPCRSCWADWSLRGERRRDRPSRCMRGVIEAERRALVEDVGLDQRVPRIRRVEKLLECLRERGAARRWRLPGVDETDCRGVHAAPGASGGGGERKTRLPDRVGLARTRCSERVRTKAPVGETDGRKRNGAYLRAPADRDGEERDRGSRVRARCPERDHRRCVPRQVRSPQLEPARDGDLARARAGHPELDRLDRHGPRRRHDEGNLVAGRRGGEPGGDRDRQRRGAYGKGHGQTCSAHE